VIVFPLAVPASVKVFPEGDPDCTVIPSVPFTFPLKLPDSAKVPLAVSPETKHGELVCEVEICDAQGPIRLCGQIGTEGKGCRSARTEQHGIPRTVDVRRGIVRTATRGWES
jgi:hypothetical protein